MEVKGLITDFYALGPKNYCIVFINDKEKKVQEIKSRGFRFNSQTASKAVNIDSFKTLVKSFLHKEENQEYVPQFNILINKNTKQLYSQLGRKVFKNYGFSKRVVISKNEFEYYNATLPFGFNNYLLNNIIQES